MLLEDVCLMLTFGNFFKILNFEITFKVIQIQRKVVKKMTTHNRQMINELS